MARVHRIGQTKSVHVYRLIAAGKLKSRSSQFTPPTMILIKLQTIPSLGTVEERILERAQKKLYLDRMVMQDGANINNDDDGDESHLLAALKFGCNAIFGAKANQAMKLPTQNDIEMLTDRERTEEYSGGMITGGAAADVKDFDSTKLMTATTDFGGIDFKAIRSEYKKKRRPKDVGHILDMWRDKKRERKSRITLISTEGSGYGSKSIPVLQANNYNLEEGERSVLQQELAGPAARFKDKGRKILKAGVDFENQDECIICGQG